MNKNEFLAINEQDRLGQVLEGVAFYASVQSPNMSSVKKFNGEPYYIVNLGLSDAEQKKATSYGLKVLPPEGEINMPYVKLKRKASKTKTIEQAKPTVVDTAGNVISELIGNGSKVRCKFATYWFDNGAGGVASSLYKVQVLDLIPFKPVDRDFVSDGSGFVSNATTGTANIQEEFEALEDDDIFDQ